MVRAVLFDLDETLFDRTGSLRRFLAAQHARISDLRDVPLDEFVVEFLKRDKRGTVPKTQVYPSLLDHFGKSSKALGQLLLDEYNQTFRNFAKAFPGLEELKQGLTERDLSTGIVTNGHVIGQNATIIALGLNGFFDTILISESEGIRKPDREIFLRAANKLNRQPSDCVFVGDTPSADMSGAQGAGMRTIWFPNGAIWPDSLSTKADAEIASLPDVLRVLDQWCR